ncbi:MAG: DUF4936 family protein [Rhodocyclaceae bacterium]
MKLDYYIYYRLSPERNHADAREAVRSLQSRMLARTGVSGRLMVRRDDGHTWMEIYPDVIDAEAFDAALEEETRAAGFETWLEPATVRHVERFVECA